MEVKLIGRTNACWNEGEQWSVATAEELCASAARGCYSAKSSYDNIQEMTEEKMKKTLAHAIEGGHHSVLEHMQFTFSVSGVSRTLTHQLVRHRVGTAFSQQSQRYVKFTGDRFQYYMPESIGNNPALKGRYDLLMCEIGQFYNDAIDAGVPAEDARYAFPNATLTNITMTLNGREAFHLIGLRACTRAQKEIRELARLVESILKEECPYVFANLGANCEQLGYCPEKESCGRKPTRNQLIQFYTENH